MMQPIPTVPWYRRALRWLGRGLLLLLLLIAGYYGAYFLLRGDRPADPALIAHRGGPVYGPENTLATFEPALADGVDWLEFDVQRTTDDVLVVFHDETVERTTDGSGALADLTWAEISALDAGDGQRVPTFADLITLDSDVRLLPEAKSPALYPGLALEMARTLIDAGAADRAIVQSFDHGVLAEMKAAYPDVAVCPLYGLGQVRLGAVEPAAAEYVCPMAEMVLLNPWLIRGAHRDGRQVFVWFGAVENPTLMRLMIALGVDGLMVNDPPALATVLGR